MLSTSYSLDQSILTCQPLMGLNFISHPSILSNSYVLSINSTFSLYLLAWFCHLQLNNLWIRQKLRLKRDHGQNLGEDFSNVQSWFKKQTFSSFLLRSDWDMQIMTKYLCPLNPRQRTERRKVSKKALYATPIPHHLPLAWACKYLPNTREIPNLLVNNLFSETSKFVLIYLFPSLLLALFSSSVQKWKLQEYNNVESRGYCTLESHKWG